jgi:hypothetical protein
VSAINQRRDFLLLRRRERGRGQAEPHEAGDDDGVVHKYTAQIQGMRSRVIIEAAVSFLWASLGAACLRGYFF